MSMPLSTCDVSARYGQLPAPQCIVEGQAGWNARQSFSSCLSAALELREQNARESGQDPMEAMTEAFLDNISRARELRKQRAKEDEENALMAVIDAMTASEEDKSSGKLEQTLTESLMRAGKSIAEQSEEILEDGTRSAGWVDPLTHLSVRVLLSCVSDRFDFDQVDQMQENIRQTREDRNIRESEKEGLDVTEKRDRRPDDPTVLERR